MTVLDWYELWICSGTDETFSEWQERQLLNQRGMNGPYSRIVQRPEPPPYFYSGNPEDICSVCGVKAKDHHNANAHNFVK